MRYFVHEHGCTWQCSNTLCRQITNASQGIKAQKKLRTYSILKQGIAHCVPDMPLEVVYIIFTHACSPIEAFSVKSVIDDLKRRGHTSICYESVGKYNFGCKIFYLF